MSKTIDSISEETKHREFVEFLRVENDQERRDRFLGFAKHRLFERKEDFKHQISTPELQDIIVCSLATQLLHKEARIASLLGEGFYTIGPCGEELLGAIGSVLRHDDPAVYHYRHVATQVVREMTKHRVENNTSSSYSGGEDCEQWKRLKTLLMDRVRGYVCSSLDPVSQGVHTLIGGGEFDYVATSTLSSQCPSAVGRALGGQLCEELNTKASRLGLKGGLIERPKFPKDFVSYVSVGDGSVNNAHFLSATNIADYANHRNFKCPMVFTISNNSICISLESYDYLMNVFLKHKLSMPVYQASIYSIFEVYDQASAAIHYARRYRSPVCFVVNDIPRRFGHAATDRQSAYMSNDRIEQVSSTERNPLCYAIHQACTGDNPAFSFHQLAEIYQRLDEIIIDMFAQASQEPKNDSIGRSGLISQLAPAQLAESSKKYHYYHSYYLDHHHNLTTPALSKSKHKPIKQVMRKNMTQLYDELLTVFPNLVYVGEDVMHGGYYLVTDQLVDKHPLRVRDFPPDETSLVGAGIGYAQSGLLPIIEIPYAKYLDCGADMFFEAAILHWLSPKKVSKCNGMIIRLQGFDKGVFGGNFHTHNSLYLPPGVDVLCFSNGEDYVRGMRNAVVQAYQGRVVMVVDSTHLLNLRHVNDGDGLWLRNYPLLNSAENDQPSTLTFDEIRVYTKHTHHAVSLDKAALDNLESNTNRHVIIISYGNGVVTSLQARDALIKEDNTLNVTVIDTPYLSKTPKQLEQLLRDIYPQQFKSSTSLVFADVCKHGQHPLAAMICTLQEKDILQSYQTWQCVAATPTYNPLGSTITFTSVQDIIDAVHK